MVILFQENNIPYNNEFLNPLTEQIANATYVEIYFFVSLSPFALYIFLPEHERIFYQNLCSNIPIADLTQSPSNELSSDLSTSEQYRM